MFRILAQRVQTKICSKCYAEKPLDEFYPRADGTGHGLGVRAKCITCFNENRTTDIRKRVIEALGGECECCGENRFEFLALDHKNGIVTDEDRKYRAGKELAFFIMRQGCPKDKYRVLCHNCNMAIGFFGYCPHSGNLV